MPGVFQVDEERGDPVMARGGAGEQDAPRGVLRVAGPDFLTVDDPIVALGDGSGGQRRQVASGTRFGKALTPLLATGQQPRHHFRCEFCRRVVDHRGCEHLDHRVGARLGEAATDHLLADDRAKHCGSAQSADFFGPSVSHPTGVVERPVDSGKLLDVAFQRVIRPRCQVVLVEPGPQVGPELLDLHGEGRPTACGRPESCAPLRRMKVMARVFSRHPSPVRT